MADSKLPSAMLGKKEELERQESGTQEPQTTPPAKDDPPADPPHNKNEADRVTISREEFNELQAKADRVKRAEGQAQSLRDDVEALQARLTDLESAPKGRGMGDAPAPADAPPAAIQFDPAPVPLTEKEKEDFESDTVELITKIARNIARQEIASVLPSIEAKLGEIDKAAKNAVTTVGKVSTNSFTGLVRNEVAKFSNFDEIVNHQHWQSFLQGVNDLAGEDYATILTNNIRRENLQGVVKIFRMFFDKYMGTPSRPEGYAGAEPSAATALPDSNNKREILRISERREAHKKFISKQINLEEYEAIKQKFDIADREGRVDYDN